MSFVVHPHKGRGWLTDMPLYRGRASVILEEGARVRLSPMNLFEQCVQPAFPPMALEFLTATFKNSTVKFDANLAWHMIHPARQRHAFESLAQMRDLVEGATIEPARLASAKLNVPVIVGTFFGQSIIIDGNHRCTKAINEGVCIAYYRLSAAETNYLRAETYELVAEDDE